MKKLHYLLFAMIMGLAVSFTSCSSDNDSPLAPVDPVEPTPELPVANKTIAELRALTTGEAVEVPADFIFKGIVVSSQGESNNFYQAIYLQDGDVAVKISCLKGDDKFYETFVAGQEVFVKAAGLFIGKNYDTYVLGFEADAQYTVTRMPEANLKAVAIGGDLNKNITPKEVTDLSTLTADMVGTLVKVTGVQVIEADKTKKLGDKDNKGYTELNFVTIDNKKISISNSNYADFNEVVVPEGSGSITGILNTFKSDFRLALTSAEDLDLEGDRFDVVEPVIPFVDKTVDAMDETFAEAVFGEKISFDGWFSEATEGTLLWMGKEYNSNQYMQASAFDTGLDAATSWIVTPGLNLDAADSKKNFSFETKRGKSNGETLEVYVSDDFDFNTGVAAATWVKQTVTLADANADGYSAAWVNSGVIDLSSFSGTVHVAFKYVGNATTATGTYQVDNVKFNYNPTDVVDPEEPTEFSNWGLEDWSDDTTPTGYYQAYNFSKESTNKHGGSFSGKFAAGKNKMAVQLPVEAGATYKVSYWYYDNGDGKVRMYSYVKDDAGTNLTNDFADKLKIQPNSYSENKDSWEEYSVTITIPEGVTMFEFAIRSYNDANTSGGEIFIDDLSVVKQ